MTSSAKRPPRAILLDIEGTVAPVDFVHRQMFPFARRELDRYLKQHLESDSLRTVCAQVIAEAEGTAPETSCDLRDPVTFGCVVSAVTTLMDRDAKVTGLKQLQGMIWQQGFESGELRAPIFDDVPAFLHRCRDAHVVVHVYSSGSIKAQQLFFGNTLAGDLRPLLAGYYDTTSGPKTERRSYGTIVGALGEAPSDVLFISDVVAELDAARDAGLRTILCVRPGNPPITAPHDHPTTSTFADLI